MLNEPKFNVNKLIFFIRLNFPKYSVALKRFKAMLKKNIPIFLFVILLTGLFASRALLSITQLLWTLYAIWQLSKTKNQFYKKPIFLWSCIPLILWILGAWQNRLSGDSLNYLMTLSAYPATVCIVASISNELIERKMIEIWLVATGIGLFYPFTWYLLHFNSANIAYGAGKSLPTFMDSDHVRFSIFLCSSFLFLLFYPVTKKYLNQILAAILFFLILILSVRTGWVMLFIIVFFFSLDSLKNNKRNAGKLFLSGFFLLIIFLVIAYLFIPTIQQKIAYSIWDWQQYHPGKYDPNYSDGTRRAINYSVWNTIKNDFNIQVGWSNISNVLQESFAKDFVGQKTEYGWPFNQWLFWWLGSGWWGMLLFSGWLFYPILWGYKHIHVGMICWTIAIALSCMVESTLNYQYGVFLHIWPIAFLWKNQLISKSGSS